VHPVGELHLVKINEQPNWNVEQLEMTLVNLGSSSVSSVSSCSTVFQTNPGAQRRALVKYSSSWLDPTIAFAAMNSRSQNLLAGSVDRMYATSL
jgi:hypothetical protein